MYDTQIYLQNIQLIKNQSNNGKNSTEIVFELCNVVN